MRCLLQWFLCLLAWDRCAVRTWAKMVMGIANGEDYRLISTFCFTFPDAVPGMPVPNGHIHSQTIVSSSGHKFLVVNRTEVEKGVPCDELVRKAKVIEPLTERSKEVIAYDLTLNVESSMNRQHVAAVIARCGQTVSAEYIVEFTNPGGFFEQQFACEDQGLFQNYMWLVVFVLVLALPFYFAFRVLHRRQAHNDVSALFFAAAGFFGTRVCFFLVHVVVYARTGMGLGMLLFLSQFLDFIATTLLAVVLVALVHGVYLIRPSVPAGSEERDTLIRVLGGFTVTYLVSTLACGFRLDSELTPFGILRGPASWPYLIARLATGVFCFKKGVALAGDSNDGLQGDKKHLVTKFSFVALAWLGAMPVVMLFSGEDSWRHNMLVVEAANLGAFGVLLYFFWPSRFGSTFSCVKPTERAHPYAEFGLQD
mmetsp:Transcript_44601/g.77265  ORF Transcript_44601/g.77265 Transcript_44601/m.77265 type:complete len:424 (-) Transcript_44601:138-1409(-)